MNEDVRRHYRTIAEGMIAEHTDAGERARWIAGLYASVFLEDPLVQSWAGLAAFVALQVSRVLENKRFSMLSEGNLIVFRSMMPALLRFRDGVVVQGPPDDRMAGMRDADRLARHDLDTAFHLVARSTEAMSDYEHRHVVQDLYASVPEPLAILLSRLSVFRIGADLAAERLRFRGGDVRDVEQRTTWVHLEILPAWERARRERMEWLRADLDRVRRHAGVRLHDLPPAKARGLKV